MVRTWDHIVLLSKLEQKLSAACSCSKLEFGGMERHVKPSFLVFTLLSHLGCVDFNFVKI